MDCLGIVTCLLFILAFVAYPIIYYIHSMFKYYKDVIRIQKEMIAIRDEHIEQLQMLTNEYFDLINKTKNNKRGA